MLCALGERWIGGLRAQKGVSKTLAAHWSQLVTTKLLSCNTSILPFLSLSGTAVFLPGNKARTFVMSAQCLVFGDAAWYVVLVEEWNHYITSITILGSETKKPACDFLKASLMWPWKREYCVGQWLTWTSPSNPPPFFLLSRWLFIYLFLSPFI